MVQLYANGTLIYDPFLYGYELQGLTATVGVNKGGTAEIVMPPEHPAYNSFVSFRTIVTIYRHGKLVFRGRALYPVDDFYGTRTITCEGERCFLCDAIVRPYLWQADPATIFSELIAIYNAQVDDFKKFNVGKVTVTDPNEYVRLEGENAETVSDVLDKLIERVGGYITFTNNEDGEREINWLAELENKSKQRIEFGENLLDFSRSGENTELATRLIPYGAKDETTGKRITIESVNNGLDYIQDDDVIAIRGIITATAEWDDVTLPQHLMTKARQELDVRKLIVTTLTLSAVDLSAMDKDIDSFDAGDWVEVFSAPHAVHGDFLLNERKYDFLDPSKDTVTMGKELVTLTGAAVTSNWAMQTKLEKTTSSIKTDVKTTVNEAANALASKVNTASAYMTNDGLMIQWGRLSLFDTSTGTVSGSSVAIRDEASSSGTVLVRVNTGETVAVTAYGVEWCAVTYGEYSGFMMTEYLTFSAVQPRIVFAYPFSAAPSVTVTALGTTPVEKCACVCGITVDGADVYAGVGVAEINWIAVGKAEII